MRTGTPSKTKIAILMSVRDEDVYIDLNIAYHLSLGIDYIFICNHCSIDNSRTILSNYAADHRVVVVEENDPTFDHAKIINKLISYANTNYAVDWFLFLDADEFLSIADRDIHNFVSRLENAGIPYATIGWANALFDYTFSDYRCAPAHAIDTTKFYNPWPEKEWQEYGHFRKALVKNHTKIEVVPGGHYVKTENNPEFFEQFHWNPFIIPMEQAKLLHFELRDKAESLYAKWQKLASFESDSSSDPTAPWLERIRTIRQYVTRFRGNIEAVAQRWFHEQRTFWGTLVPENRVFYDTTLFLWYRKYFRAKCEHGHVNSVCIVRASNLGDVIMTEPVARFLLKYVEHVYLATELSQVKTLLKPYSKVYDYAKIHCDELRDALKIRLVYELSNNHNTYIQAYMESIGFGDVTMTDLPQISYNSTRTAEAPYILIAPFTSSWNEKKRCWAYKNFEALGELLSRELRIKCILLENHYSFDEMMSLITHCEFFVGNDSGPAIIAQSFKKKSFIIFGATHPKYLHLSDDAVPIFDKERHKLCKHQTREEEIVCCEEFCMDRFTVKHIADIISAHTWRASM